MQAACNAWWIAKFYFAWPEESEPAWHRDLLVAHRIAAPVLQRHRQDIEFWRFHRRWARDQYGHRFSFYIYATPATADRVFAALKDSPLLARLGAAGLVEKIEYDDTATPLKPTLESASDRNWPLAIARTWPHFIKGVSEMWLHLIDEIAAGEEPLPDAAGLEELEAYYRRIDEIITGHWQQEGRHALLHHLNALFGYGPLLMRF